MLSFRPQFHKTLRAAILLDETLRHGEYEAALELANRDLLRSDLEKTLLIPYIAALFIETGRLQDAEQALNLAGSNAIFPDAIGRAAVGRERAALFLARKEFNLAVAEAKKAYKLAKEDSLSRTRRAYTGSIAVEALLRSGDVAAAKSLAGEIGKAVPRRVKRARFFLPRILYAVSLADAYAGSFESAEAMCTRGLKMAEHPTRDSRDLSLGFLVLAEIHLRAGDLPRAREAANRALLLIEKLFGTAHQDAVRAREILAASAYNADFMLKHDTGQPIFWFSSFQ